MSILGNDFEENISQVVESQFIYCDIAINYSTQIYSPKPEETFLKIGEIIGPLEPVNDNMLQYIRDYRDIMHEINDEVILKGLGVKKILSVNCSITGKNLVVVKLFIRLISGATTQYNIFYKHVKETKR